MLKHRTIEEAEREFKSIQKWLVQTGFKQYPSTLSKNALSYEYREKIDGPDCDCNDKPPAIHAKLHPPIPIDHNIVGPDIQFEIFGEQNEMWLKIELYSIDTYMLDNEFNLIIKRMTRIWNAFCKE